MRSYSVRTSFAQLETKFNAFFKCTAAPVQSDWTVSIWELESLATYSQLDSRCSQTVLTHQSAVVVSGSRRRVAVQPEGEASLQSPVCSFQDWSGFWFLVLAPAIFPSSISSFIFPTQKNPPLPQNDAATTMI